MHIRLQKTNRGGRLCSEKCDYLDCLSVRPQDRNDEMTRPLFSLELRQSCLAILRPSNVDVVISLSNMIDNWLGERA
jgi:hypothetical protein